MLIKMLRVNTFYLLKINKNTLTENTGELIIYFLKTHKEFQTSFFSVTQYSLGIECIQRPNTQNDFIIKLN